MEPIRKKCIIISGGRYTVIPQVNQPTYVIACDKGYEYAVRQGIVPDLVMGDFDSCAEEFKPVSVSTMQVETYPSEKDDTDTMLAIKRALELGYEEIGIYCALGGRMDHLYANLQSLVYGAKQGAVCYIEDENNMIHAIGCGKMELTSKEGWSISLFAATDVCKGVTIKGLKYTLEDGELVNSFPLGVSNEWADKKATVEVTEGVLLIMQSRIVGVL